ncbi:hypothetical protein SUNI508_08214 [Seiridium unicorne]|uniref:Uncharacterized protein n=1 Tax=Seiridium unicorne TaxID=138068 RepID=A0ABR2UUC7_9PEZI
MQSSLSDFSSAIIRKAVDRYISHTYIEVLRLLKWPILRAERQSCATLGGIITNGAAAAAGLHSLPGYLLSHFHVNNTPLIKLAASVARRYSIMERLTFFFDGIDNAPTAETTSNAPTSTVFENKAVDILRRYLQIEDSSSLTSAAQAIISLLSEPLEPRGWSEELTAFWGVDQSRDIKYISEFHLLKETIRDAYNPAFSAQDSKETSSPEDGQRWVNTIAFYAHMHALNGGMLSTYCTWTMHDAFESTPSTNYVALDCHISAATQWIIYSGQNILSAILVPPEKAESDSMLGHREPWTLNGWRRWKTGFAEAEREEHLQQETRQLAKRSASLMEALEAAMISVYMKA